MADSDQSGAWLLKAFAMGGVDVHELFRRLPEQMDQATRAPETLTPDVVNAILLQCASLSADDNFGLRMVELASDAAERPLIPLDVRRLTGRQCAATREADSKPKQFDAADHCHDFLP